MLKRKVGVLATRSPHRPNPIGVTLARIHKVDKDKRIIHLTACDLVHGTPVLDVKVTIYTHLSIHLSTHCHSMDSLTKSLTD